MQRSKKNQSGVYVVFGPTTRKAIFFWSQATKKMQGWGMQGMQKCCILWPSGQSESERQRNALLTSTTGTVVLVPDYQY